MLSPVHTAFRSAHFAHQYQQAYLRHSAQTGRFQQNCRLFTFTKVLSISCTHLPAFIHTSRISVYFLCSAPKIFSDIADFLSKLNNIQYSSYFMHYTVCTSSSGCVILVSVTTRRCCYENQRQWTAWIHGKLLWYRCIFRDAHGCQNIIHSRQIHTLQAEDL